MKRKAWNTSNRNKLCPKGHDKDKTGRDKRGRCLLCKKLRQRIDPSKDSRLKQFCHNGHDTSICGRIHGMCNICHVEYKKKYRKEHIEDTRKWRKEHKKEIRAYTLRYHRGWYLKTMYNLTTEDYDNMLKLQKGKCAGCGRHYSEFKRALYIDHDHACCPGKKSCGKCVRGLVCDDCNKLLGNAKDNVKTLKRLIGYLNKNKEKINGKVR